MLSTMVNSVKYVFKKHPLLSNSVIYGTFYFGAEFSQQLITRKILAETPVDIDKPTLARYAIMGTFVYSPYLFAWYKWLDNRYVGTSVKIISKKLFLDQFIMTPPLLMIFFTGMSLMEGAADPLKEMKEKFIPTFGKSCLLWLPAQTINFLYIPARFRIMYMATCSFAWVNIMCMIKRQQAKEAALPNAPLAAAQE